MDSYMFFVNLHVYPFLCCVQQKKRNVIFVRSLLFLVCVYMKMFVPWSMQNSYLISHFWVNNKIHYRLFYFVFLILSVKNLCRCTHVCYREEKSCIEPKDLNMTLNCQCNFNTKVEGIVKKNYNSTCILYLSLVVNWMPKNNSIKQTDLLLTPLWL